MPSYWPAIRNQHNIWLSRTEKLKPPDKHESAIPLPVSSFLFNALHHLAVVFWIKSGLLPKLGDAFVNLFLAER